jgi:hypothetical protein
LDGDEGPFLIHDMARGRALVDVFERKRPVAQDNLATGIPDDMIQPRRGQVCPGSMIFMENFNYGFIGHSVHLSCQYQGHGAPRKFIRLPE